MWMGWLGLVTWWNTVCHYLVEMVSGVYVDSMVGVSDMVEYCLSLPGRNGK